MSLETQEAGVMQPFQFQSQVCHPFYGPWVHVPPHVWKTADASNSAATQDDGADGVDIWKLCSQKHTTTLCGECNENYCAECIDRHICGEKLFIRHNTCHKAQTWYYVMCSIGNGLGSILVCLWGFSSAG